MKHVLFLTTLIVLISFISCQNDNEINNKMIDMSHDWKIISSDKIDHTGEEISTASIEATDWYATDVPSTVLAALVGNGVYENIFFGDNFSKIPKEPFQSSWWYRKSFETEGSGKDYVYQLVFEGLNYSANIWLNGKLLAERDNVEQPFRMFRFDVSDLVKEGENFLAVEVFPPVKGDLTIGFVDWNPWPPDNNLGLWRPVKLLRSGKVSVKNTFVKPILNTETLEQAQLEIIADIVNHADQNTTATISCEFEGITLTKQVKLNPGETRKVILTPDEFPDLVIDNPRIWWPVHLGEPNLYDLSLNVMTNGHVSDSESVRFGIRDVKDYINEEGFRGYMINGEKILIRGAGWVDDVLLNDSDEKVLSQIEYVKHMNLNTIRLEGFWGRNKKIYEYADEHGILVMIGWSCQWEWEGYCGREEDDKYMSIFENEFDLHAQAYKDQVYWLRNHPSVFLWVYGSDKLLRPGLETALNNFINTEDGTRPILGSCKEMNSDVTGPSAVKMRGPYGYVTPNYWYEDSLAGGAFGFNTETGPGIQPSPLESIKRMIPEDHLWPIDDMWRHHLGRNEFTTFRFWMKPFNNRYGEEDNVEDFTFKAQMANYEALRPMLEAFAVNKYRSTGVIQWMLNSAFPSMLWQLYDWYLMPNGAFYAAKKACQPLNVVYNYKDKHIYLTNELKNAYTGLKVGVKVLDINSKIVFENQVETEIAANTSNLAFKMPSLEGISTTYFVDLTLTDSEDREIASNFYWLSTKPDVCDYENSDWFITYNTAYADLTGINSMSKSNVEVSHTFQDQGDRQSIEVELFNNSENLAFFIELSLKGKDSGQSILPVFWEDNYVSILPGETKKISGYVYKKNLGEESLVFSYKGWNVNN